MIYSQSEFHICYLTMMSPEIEMVWHVTAGCMAIALVLLYCAICLWLWWTWPFSLEKANGRKDECDDEPTVSVAATHRRYVALGFTESLRRPSSVCPSTPAHEPSRQQPGTRLEPTEQRATDRGVRKAETQTERDTQGADHKRQGEAQEPRSPKFNQTPWIGPGPPSYSAVCS